MSTFVDYSRVARNYDAYRRPDGADVEVAMMQLYCNKPLKSIHVLDAGCGTGNYANEFLKYGVGKVTLLDASIEMLEKALKKLEADSIANENVFIVQAKLPDIPLHTGIVDVVVFNTVLNHLVSNPDGTSFPEIEHAIAESHRVLKPGGIICILGWTPSTIMEDLWFTGINKIIGERLAKRFPSIKQLDDIFRKTKFQRVNVMHLCLTEMMNTYRNPEGPLDEGWREFIVFFNDATETELQDVQKQVRFMKDAGTLDAYMNDNDRTSEHGFRTLTFARAL